MRYKFRRHPSKLATLMVTFGAGSRVEYETEYPCGIAHFMEHVRFKGTETYSAKDLLRKTADAGGSWNAWTSHNLVSYHMTIPEENIETAFQCLSEVVLNPIFPQHELEKEKEVVCQEVRMYDDMLGHLVDLKLRRMVFDNPLSNPICGTEESVRSITRDDLIRFNEEFYSKEHMLISLSAGGDHISLAEKYFGISDDTLLFNPAPESVIYKSSGRGLVEKEGQLQNEISIAYGGPEVRKIADQEKHTLKVFSTIFGRGDTSRLFMKIREDLGLVYGIGSYMSDNMDGSLYEIYTSTEPGNTEKILEAVDEEITNFLASPPEEQELSRAKNLIKSSYYKMLESGEHTAHNIVNEEFFGHEVASELLAKIENVSIDDVVDVAKRIFSETKYTVVGTGK